MIHHGDCLEVMAGMGAESVDAICTDPPYGLRFMGKEWDSLSHMSEHTPGFFGGKDSGNHHSGAEHWQPNLMQAWHTRWAEAAYRVAKPSAYLLAFGGTRTVHRMTVALEDAGWIIRDMLVWGYASGFPKSKASLKPAWEPIVMARKPGPLRMLAIDECRIPGAWTTWRRADGSINPSAGFGDEYVAGTERPVDVRNPEDPAGRWPANIVLTDPIFDGGIEGVVGGGESQPGSGIAYGSHGFDGGMFGRGRDVTLPDDGYGDSGTYSRFFLIAKSDRTDREPVLGMGGEAKSGGRFNVHPTQAVKPTDLMRHLVRLVTPTGGTVLDPFLGSGTTAIAAEMEGFAWIGIEREAEYVAIAEARLNGTQRGLGLDVGAPTPKMPNTHPDLSKHQPKQRAPGENYSGHWGGTADTSDVSTLSMDVTDEEADAFLHALGLDETA